MIEYIIASIAGFNAKLYDDLVSDNDIIKSEVIKQMSIGIAWILFTLLCSHDFNFMFYLYILVLVNFFAEPFAYSNAYETSGLIIFPLLFFYNFSTRTRVSILEMLFIAFGMLGFIGESLIIKEDVSVRKLIMRVLACICIIIDICIAQYFNFSSSIIKLLFYFLAYMGSSVLFQIYSLYINPDIQKTHIHAEKPLVETRPETPKEVTEEIKEEDALRV